MKMLYRKVDEGNDPMNPYFRRGFEIIWDWRQFLIGASWYEGCAGLHLGPIACIWWWWSND